MTFNRRHGKVGHLFQGRFKAILVDRDSYLLEVCRYVELKPTRARIAAKPEAWFWSSYRAHVGLTKCRAGWMSRACMADLQGGEKGVSVREVTSKRKMSRLTCSMRSAVS